MQDDLYNGSKMMVVLVVVRFTHTNPYNHLTALCLGLPGLASTRRNIHPLTPVLIFKHPLSTSFIYYDQYTWLTVLFHNLSPGPLWSSSWSGTLYFMLYTFFHQIIIFLFTTHAITMFCCSTEIMSSIPNISFSSLLGNLSLTLIPHIHLTILISAHCIILLLHIH